MKNEQTKRGILLNATSLSIIDMLMPSFAHISDEQINCINASNKLVPFYEVPTIAYYVK